MTTRQERQRELNRTAHQQRRARGLCTRCGQVNASACWNCVHCRRAMSTARAQQARVWRAGQKSAGGPA